MLNTLAAWEAPNSIAELFIRYWLWAADWPPEFRQLASLKNNDFDRLVRGALSKDDEGEVLVGLERFIPRIQGEAERPQILSLLRLVDDAFQAIHPRAMHLPLLGKAASIPVWLRNYRELRAANGAYADMNGFRLIPRGPLLRVPRQPLAANADTLADRFSALSLIPARVKEFDRAIHLRQIVVPMGILSGVPSVRPPGHERIVHVPIMEAAEDLTLSLSTHSDCEFISYALNTSIDAADRLRAAAKDAGGADILMAPEFTIDEVAADALMNSLQVSNDVSYRLIAAGTGDTGSTNNSLPYNEMRLMNGFGTELWRQRKLWPAFIDADFARKLGITPVTNAIYEATSSGDTLVISDLDSLGRVMVLICQDFKLAVITSLVQNLQPDWILVPVMDRGVDKGRWTHQRAFELSENTQSRFVIGSGLSLAAHLHPNTVPCIMAVGPKIPASADDQPRAFRVELASGKKGATFATIDWRSDGWLTSNLTAEGP